MHPPLRRARPEDRPLMAAALAEAAAWREGVAAPVEAVIAPPAIGKYLAGWPQPGEAGLVGEGQGACWWRLFTVGDASYGWVADDLGEVTIGVLPAWRREGVGTALLTGLIGLAAGRGLAGLSLSVEVDNPAVRLYAAAGFTPAAAVHHGAVTMVRRTGPADHRSDLHGA